MVQASISSASPQVIDVTGGPCSFHSKANTQHSIETNVEALCWLQHNLIRINNGELSAVDANRQYHHAAGTRPFGDNCLEAAYMSTSMKNLVVLFHGDEDDIYEMRLCWIQLAQLTMRKQAQCDV